MKAEQDKPAETICQACGTGFSCGASGGACWCFDVKISAEDLRNLQKIYQNCLCPNCLIYKIELLLPGQDSIGN